MWFDVQTAGLLGGALGGVMGICGGIIGIMAGISARKAKFKKIILAITLTLIVFGAILLCFGIIALIMRQPYHVWYPFVLTGGISTAVFLPNYFHMKKIYKRTELNKILETNNITEV